jgi:hypothetical protein
MINIPKQEYRGFHIVSDGTFTLKNVTTIGKGSVPDRLKGKYTTSAYAQKDIDTYLDEDRKHAKRNVSTGG